MTKVFFTVLGIAAFLGGGTLFFAEIDFGLFTYKLFSLLLFGYTLGMGLLKDRDFLSPFTLFAMTPFAAIVYSNYVSNLFLPLPGGLSMLYIIMGQSFFLLGLTIFRFRQRFSGATYKEVQRDHKLQLKSSYWILYTLGILPLFVSLYYNSLPSDFASSSVADYRANFQIPILSALTCLSTAALIYVGYLNRYKLFLAMALVVLLLGIFMWSKMNIALIFLTVIYCKLRFWKHKNRTLVLISIVISVGTMFVVDMVRKGAIDIGSYTTSYDYFYRSQRISQLPSALQYLYDPYVYITAPLSNFAYLVENDVESTGGMLTAWPFLSTFQIKRALDLDPPDKPIRNWPYNTHSFLADFWMDFGVVGIIILPFMLGILVYYIYIRSIVKNNFLNHTEYLYFAFATLMLFFSNHFTSVAYPLQVLVVLETYRLLFTRKCIS